MTKILFSHHLLINRINYFLNLKYINYNGGINEMTITHVANWVGLPKKKLTERVLHLEKAESATPISFIK